jgi:dihydroflavonol-4-reductase
VFRQAPYDEVLDEGRAYAGAAPYDYERSKRFSHELALSYNAPGFEVIALAPTAVIGPYDYRPSRIGETVINLYRGRIPAIFSGGIDFVDVRDVAEAIVAALTHGSPGGVYLLSGGWHSLASLRDAVALVAGRRIKVPVLPVWLVRAAVPFVRVITRLTGRLGYFNRAAIDKVTFSNRRVDSSRARADLGFDARPFDTTVRDTVQWFREQGVLR